jgi:hypothetical protein
MGGSQTYDAGVDVCIPNLRLQDGKWPEKADVQLTPCSPRAGLGRDAGTATIIAGGLNANNPMIALLPLSSAE